MTGVKMTGEMVAEPGVAVDRPRPSLAATQSRWFARGKKGGNLLPRPWILDGIALTTAQRTGGAIALAFIFAKKRSRPMTKFKAQSDEVQT